ncbi:MAG: hypothetical protein BCS36_02870 [Desulfovibrio sp. MES5]|uniref:hypothetical protein n=1 Tax=Desulfovibrio sp. MES5 TaxID=1899016 RepID=UPI000B9CC8E1|nr:hypothetical protein [Desulfovibrio sp. MES5]OXS28172.1 MAG: hypothetical protein BCS36_02870 [Desulfovibrio sp. MES5]
MRRPLVIIALLSLLATLPGCASIGLENPFSNDPLTGGTDTTTSLLLGVPTPAGMQRYGSHGFQDFGPGGGRQGLEVLRGKIDTGFAAQIMYSGLQGQGWQLRLALRKGARAVYVYDRGSTMAVLTFESQTLLTVLNIWVADRLPDGAPLPMQDAAGSSGGSGGSDGSGGLGGSGDAGGMNTAPQGGQTSRGGTYGGGSGGLQERNL